MSLLLRWLVSATAIILTPFIVPGVIVESFLTALWLSVFLGFINAIIRPVLIILTLPINVLTLGLFTFVINASLILFASWAIDGFSVRNFWSALLFSIVLSILSYLLRKTLKNGKFEL